jgi:hypothetical protein
VPIGEPYFATTQEANAFYLQFAVASIRAHPAAYLRHAAAHFYGLWRDLGRTEPLKISTTIIRTEPEPLEIRLRNAVPASILQPYPEPAQLKTERISQEMLPLAFDVIWGRYWIRPQWTIALGLLALGLSLLFLIPGRLAMIYRTEIMIALSLNAYFAAHAMLQVSLTRYASAGILPALMLGAGFVMTSLGCVSRSARFGHAATNTAIPR